MNYTVIKAKENWSDRIVTLILLSDDGEHEYKLSINDFDKICANLGYKENEDDIRERWITGKEISLSLIPLSQSCLFF